MDGVSKGTDGVVGVECLGNTGASERNIQSSDGADGFLGGSPGLRLHP